MKHSLKYLVVALTLTTATVASADGFLTDSYGSSAQSASAFGASGASSDRETWATYARPSAAPAGTSVNYVAFTDPLTGWQGQDFDTLGKIAAQNPRTTVRFNADGLTRETANHLADRLRRANFEGQLVLAAGSYTTETLSPFRASGAKEIVLAPERKDVGKTLRVAREAAMSEGGGTFTVDLRPLASSEAVGSFGAYRKANANVRVLAASPDVVTGLLKAGYTVQTPHNNMYVQFDASTNTLRTIDAKGNTVTSKLIPTGAALETVLADAQSA